MEILFIKYASVKTYQEYMVSYTSKVIYFVKYFLIAFSESPYNEAAASANMRFVGVLDQIPE
jgi:hypothetical protein